MFFDDIDIEDTSSNIGQEYTELLKKAAAVQRLLFSMHFDPESRTQIAAGGGQSEMKLLADLEACRQKLRENRKKAGVRRGIFWWDIPWNEVQEQLIWDLEDLPDYGNTRFERKYQVHEDAGRHYLVITEHGHVSSFGSHKSYSYDKYENYSHDEVMRRKKNLSNLHASFDLEMAMYRGGVKSVATGAEYDSGADYVFSAENWMWHDYDRSQLDSELYTTVETNTLTVNSRSTDFYAMYAVASWKEKDGELIHVELLGNKQYPAGGEVPGEITDFYESRDSAVMLAAYLSEHSCVRKVPLSLFGGELEDGTYSYKDALRQAEIYTCLSGIL